jgi:hypothetical protein
MTRILCAIAAAFLLVAMLYAGGLLCLLGRVCG